jgi:hypothetical protein
MTAYPQAATALAKLATEGDPDAFDPKEYVSVFTLGGCALYATALTLAHPTWTIVSAGEPACSESDDDPDLCPCGNYGDGVCGCMIHHFYAASPDGWLHDVRGQHDPEGILQDKALHAIGDTSLACVIESWHFNAEECEQDAAALALLLTAG